MIIYILKNNNNHNDNGVYTFHQNKDALCAIV